MTTQMTQFFARRDSAGLRPASFLWKRLAAGAALVLMALTVHAPVQAASKRVVLCYEETDVPPWRTLQGTGLNFDLLRQVAKKLDIDMQFQTLPWKRCFAQLKANEVSGAFGASFKPDRLSMGAYPGGTMADPNKRLYTDRYVLIRRKGSKVAWDGKKITNLEGSIGIQLGYSIGDQLREMGIGVDEGSQKARELAQKLVAGRVGAIALGGGEASSLIANDPLMAPQLEILPLPLIEKAYYLMLSHNFVKANPALANQIWNTIEEVRNSAAYKKLERESLDRAIR